ncbi:membrane protein [Catellatospora sp. TT07R-123]|uniref:DUF6328 family protein n=1 Tax=Catellatospora sp. TT07R-123 TaxID=2733863 RepID=UPI001B11FA4C|nr:DUF6328 family protein [Catellatospora sp. TT07R-123]GHJ44554.1 membrane protein [Catellatospora sp. TT07R-123]
MADDDQHRDQHPDPTDPWHRRYGEQLQELRVTQTGVQILFAFLLTLPFQAGFGKITGAERHLYVFSFVAAALAAALLIAPVSYHRLHFRHGEKPEIVRATHVLALVGLVFELLAIVGAVYLVLDVVTGSRWAGIGGSLIAAVYVFLWYILPMIYKPKAR